QSLVKFDRRFVPVENGPLHIGAASCPCRLRQMCEQRFAVSTAAHRIANVKVFQMDSAHRTEARKGPVPGCEPDGLTVLESEVAGARGGWAEEIARDRGLAHKKDRHEFLVFRKLSQEREHLTLVAFASR